VTGPGGRRTPDPDPIAVPGAGKRGSAFSRFAKAFRDRRRRKDLYSTAGYWDSKAERGGTSSSTSMWPNRYINACISVEREDAIWSLGLDLNGLRILDLGCGTGQFSRLLASKGAEVLGVDFSSKALDAARRLSDGPNPSYAAASVFDITEEGRYGLILAAGVLAIACKTEGELLDALSRAGRALAPGGVLLLMEPIHTGLLSRVLDMGIKEFMRCMAEAGLDARPARPLVFWPARLALAYAPFPRWVTVPGYGLGKLLMKLPLIRRLGDYWAIEARVTPGGPLDARKGCTTVSSQLMVRPQARGASQAPPGASQNPPRPAPRVAGSPQPPSGTPRRARP
jgi:2-polyprenyl-3-methyl-5-hydroxy-6-metoxy-1,4-benzoquinol methylase